MKFNLICLIFLNKLLENVVIFLFQYFRATPEFYRISCSAISGTKETVEVETEINVTILQED